MTGPTGFDGTVLESVVKEVAVLKHERGLHILIVSSGAIGCGMSKLGIKQRPRLLPLKQATAAVGQSILMHYYEVLFRAYSNGLQPAQVLLSATDLDDRRRYLNVRNTIKALFDLKTVVPIVNENDSVATEELQFGDNDTLAARVAAKIAADMLIILSDVDGLYDKNPARVPGGKLILQVDAITREIEALADGASSETSTGGMITKIEAAKIAGAAGVRTVITNGRRVHCVQTALDGGGPATVFAPSSGALSQRKRWIAFGRASRGALEIDDGAVKALVDQGRSLLAAGIRSVSGKFDMGASVKITDSSGRVIACGLVNYSSEDLNRIKGCKSGDIKGILGRKDYDEVVHRDNMALL
jgi:glutamate 5-kinase